MSDSQQGSRTPEPVKPGEISLLIDHSRFSGRGRGRARGRIAALQEAPSVGKQEHSPQQKLNQRHEKDSSKLNDDLGQYADFVLIEHEEGNTSFGASADPRGRGARRSRSITASTTTPRRNFAAGSPSSPVYNATQSSSSAPLIDQESWNPSFAPNTLQSDSWGVTPPRPYHAGTHTSNPGRNSAAGSPPVSVYKSPGSVSLIDQEGWNPSTAPNTSQLAGTHAASNPEVIIQVSGLIDKVDEIELKVYFDDKESGGEPNAVKNCILIPPGYAYVTFQRHVADRVLSKQHELSGTRLYLKPVQAVPEAEDEAVTILLKHIPQGFDKLAIELCVEGIQGVLITEVKNGSSTIYFPPLPTEELKKAMNRLELLSKRKNIVIVRCHAKTTLYIRSITKTRDKTFLKRYFSNKNHSGGGDIIGDPVLLNDGKEAIVNFKQPEVLQRILSHNHDTIFGNGVQLSIEEPQQEKTADSEPEEFNSVHVPIKPQIADAIFHCPTKLRSFGDSLNVAYTIERDHILFTSSERSCSDWQKKCEDFLNETYSVCEIHVPEELSKEIRTQFASFKQHAFKSELINETDKSTCYVLAGETEVLQAICDNISKMESHIEDSLKLESEHIDFISEFKLELLKATYPSVQITADASKQLVTFKGPSIYVEKLKQTLCSLTQKLEVIPVELDHELANYFATNLNEGQKQMRSFIKSRKCPLAVSYRAQPTEKGAQEATLSLLLVCESSQLLWAKNVQESLEKEARFKHVTVPKSLASEIDGMKDFKALVSQLKKDHDVRIIYNELDEIINVFGFGESVSDSSIRIEEFIQLKRSSATPLSFPITQFLSKALKKKKHSLEQVLADCNPNLSYSFSEPDETEILVTPNKFIKDVEWRSQCKAALNKYVKNFTTIEVTFLPDAKQDIFNYLEEKEQSSPLPFAFDLQEADTLVDIFGETALVTEVGEQLGTICSSFVIASKQLSLSLAQRAYIAQVSLENIKANHPKLNITLPIDSQTLHVTGPKAKLLNFEKHFATYKFSSITVSTDILLVDFLSVEGSGTTFLASFLDKKKNVAVAVFRSSDAQLDFLYDGARSTCENVTGIVKELQSILKVGKISIPECLKKPKKDSETKSKIIDLYKKLEIEYNVMCSYGNTEITFGGVLENVQQAVEKMSSFIKDECTITKDLQLTSPQWKLIQRDERWIRDIKEWLFEVSSLDNESKIVQLIVKLKGEECAVVKAYRKLLEIKESLKMNFIEVRAPGACKYFLSESAKTTILPGVESHYSVCIETVVLEKAKSEIFIKGIDKSPSAKEYCRVIAKFEKTKTIVTFKVYIGDITEFKADVLVNPANNQLRHSGGLAAAIVKKGGQEIQDDCDQFMQDSMFDMDEGEVYISQVVGKLPCKAIVHAIGPRYQLQSKDHAYEKSRLSRAVINTLAKAKMFASIAFPAISSGIFKYPLNECALVHIEASVKYFTTAATSITEVSFIVIDQTHAIAFHKALSNCFPGSVITLDIESSMFLIPVQSIRAARSSTSGGAAKKKSMTSSVPQLHHGDLFSTKVVIDVYVCTANSKLDLSRGVIAQHMSKLAGPDLQKECNEKGRANTGDVIVTGPGNLDCQHVFHAVAPNCSTDKDGKILRDLIRKCFQQCEKHQVNSIAFPAIGPGGLGYPIQLVASIMITESCLYLAKTKNAQFTIHLIIFDASQHKIFKSELENVQLQSTKKKKSKLFDTSSPKLAVAAANSPVTPDFHVQGIQVSVVKGDITKDSSDAIVNTTSSGINLGNSGEVSKILLKIAGPKLQDLCTDAVKKEGQLTEGKVIATKALNPLKCKSILHIYFSSNDPGLYSKTIKSCLDKAEQLQYKTIALPVIGTGAQNYPTTDAAKGTYEGINQFGLSNPKYLKQVRIVIFNEGIYDTFLTSIQPDTVVLVLSPSTSELHGEASALFDDDMSPLEFESNSDDELTSRRSPSAFNYWSSSREISSSIDEDDLSHSGADHETPQEGLNIIICGFDESRVSGAVTRLRKLMRENFDKEEINNESIRALSNVECKEIGKECLNAGVECRIERDIGRIRLTGNVHDITKIRGKVNDIIYKVMSRKSDERGKQFQQQLQHQFEVESLYITVQWQYKKQGTMNFVDYDKEFSYEIEQAYLAFKKQTHKDMHIFHYQKEPINFTIDFLKHEEEDHKTKQHNRVRRFTTKEVGTRPDTWDEMPIHKSVHCVDLKPDSIEYKEVLVVFNQTVSKSEIITIQRVQNPRLYCLYRQAKEAMDKANPPNHPNERRLFHGTDADSAVKINANGFNRSYAGRHAIAYGNGTYFARDASYSASPTYSKPDQNGHKYMYLARVLTGEYTVGKSSMVVPPPKDPTKDQNVLFDSLVNSTSAPTIFVVVPDVQSYPEYLITFK